MTETVFNTDPYIDEYSHRPFGSTSVYINVEVNTPGDYSTLPFRTRSYT